MSEATPRTLELAVEAGHHRWQLLARLPASPQGALLWLPALGVAARHYLPFAETLAARGLAVFVHEWRGNGSSNLRPGREHDWGYRELLLEDLPASLERMRHELGASPTHIGGHSLGGQLACCHLALAHLGHAEAPAPYHLWLVASGAPYWRAFPAPARYGLPLAYRFLPWLADRLGALPGRRIGFGGDEARRLIRDWAGTALSGRYHAPGLPVDLESGMARVAAKATGIVLRRDWLAPRSSLDYLLDKLPRTERTIVELDSDTLGIHADHFAWMKQPQRLVYALMGSAIRPANTQDR